MTDRPTDTTPRGKAGATEAATAAAAAAPPVGVADPADLPASLHKNVKAGDDDMTQRQRQQPKQPPASTRCPRGRFCKQSISSSASAAAAAVETSNRSMRNVHGKTVDRRSAGGDGRRQTRALPSDNDQKTAGEIDDAKLAKQEATTAKPQRRTNPPRAARCAAVPTQNSVARPKTKQVEQQRPEQARAINVHHVATHDNKTGWPHNDAGNVLGPPDGEQHHHHRSAQNVAPSLAKPQNETATITVTVPVTQQLGNGRKTQHSNSSPRHSDAAAVGTMMNSAQHYQAFGYHDGGGGCSRTAPIDNAHCDGVATTAVTALAMNGSSPPRRQAMTSPLVVRGGHVGIRAGRTPPPSRGLFHSTPSPGGLLQMFDGGCSGSHSSKQRRGGGRSLKAKMLFSLRGDDDNDNGAATPTAVPSPLPLLGQDTLNLATRADEMDSEELLLHASARLSNSCTDLLVEERQWQAYSAESVPWNKSGPMDERQHVAMMGDTALVPPTTTSVPGPTHYDAKHVMSQLERRRDGPGSSLSPHLQKPDANTTAASSDNDDENDNHDEVNEINDALLPFEDEDGESDDGSTPASASETTDHDDDDSAMLQQPGSPVTRFEALHERADLAATNGEIAVMGGDAPPPVNLASQEQQQLRDDNMGGNVDEAAAAEAVAAADSSPSPQGLQETSNGPITTMETSEVLNLMAPTLMPTQKSQVDEVEYSQTDAIARSQTCGAAGRENTKDASGSPIHPSCGGSMALTECSPAVAVPTSAEGVVLVAQEGIESSHDAHVPSNEGAADEAGASVCQDHISSFDVPQAVPVSHATGITSSSMESIVEERAFPAKAGLDLRPAAVGSDGDNFLTQVANGFELECNEALDTTAWTSQTEGDNAEEATAARTRLDGRGRKRALVAKSKRQGSFGKSGSLRKRVEAAPGPLLLRRLSMRSHSPAGDESSPELLFQPLTDAEHESGDSQALCASVSDVDIVSTGRRSKRNGEKADAPSERPPKRNRAQDTVGMGETDNTVGNKARVEKTWAARVAESVCYATTSKYPNPDDFGQATAEETGFVKECLCPDGLPVLPGLTEFPPPIPNELAEICYRDPHGQRVLYFDFSGLEKNQVSQSAKDLLRKMMDCDDFVVICKSLLAPLDGELWDIEAIVNRNKTAYLNNVRNFRRTVTNGNVAYDPGTYVPMRLGEFGDYLYARNNFLENGGSTAFYAEKSGVHLDVENDILYMVDYNIKKYDPKLLEDFRRACKVEGILPGGEYCFTNSLNQDMRPDLGPNIYLSTGGSSTTFHQDGKGTVDSGHFAVTGYNEVVILRRLPENHRSNAAKLLSPDIDRYDPLWHEPHKGAHEEERLSPPWPTRAKLQQLADLGYAPIVTILGPCEMMHIGKGRIHAFRKLTRDRLPSDDCHHDARHELLQDKNNEIKSYCFSVAYDWINAGSDAAAVQREIAATLEYVELARHKKVQPLGQARSALLQHAKELSAEANPGKPMLEAFGDPSWRAEQIGGRNSCKDEMRNALVPFLQFCLDQNNDSGSDGEPVPLDCLPEHGQNPHGFDYLCKLCSTELSNEFWHCHGCERLLGKDFDICSSCHRQGLYRVLVSMRLDKPEDVKRFANVNHTGIFPRGEGRCLCKKIVFRCGECQLCQHCLCICHTKFEKCARFFTKDDIAGFLDCLLEMRRQNRWTEPEFEKFIRARLNYVALPPEEREACRAIIRKTLTSQGYHVDAALSGANDAV